MERGDLLACVEALGVVLHERLAQCGDRDDVLELRHGVADADLDRPESRMKPDVPPDVRVVGDATGALELSDHLRIVGIVLESRRWPRAWERREDHVARRVEARRLATPERRARRQGDELGEVPDQRVDDLDRLLRIVDRDVHVEPEDQLASRDVLHLVDEGAVAILAR